MSTTEAAETKAHSRAEAKRTDLEKGMVKLPVAVVWSEADPAEVSSTKNFGSTAPGSAWYSG